MQTVFFMNQKCDVQSFYNYHVTVLRMQKETPIKRNI